MVKVYGNPGMVIIMLDNGTIINNKEGESISIDVNYL
jgi:hypothetical protein